MTPCSFHFGCPLYSSYRKKLEQIRIIEKDDPGLKLAGNYRTGISLHYCIEAALSQLATNIS
jgi:protoporphyrinogen oxidase